MALGAAAEDAGPEGRLLVDVFDCVVELGEAEVLVGGVLRRGRSSFWGCRVLVWPRAGRGRGSG